MVMKIKTKTIIRKVTEPMLRGRGFPAGKVVFDLPKGESYYVPVIKKYILNENFCKDVAKQVGGYVKETDSHVWVEQKIIKEIK